MCIPPGPAPIGGCGRPPGTPGGGGMFGGGIIGGGLIIPGGGIIGGGAMEALATGGGAGSDPVGAAVGATGKDA